MRLQQSMQQHLSHEHRWIAIDGDQFNRICRLHLLASRKEHPKKSSPFDGRGLFRVAVETRELAFGVAGSDSDGARSGVAAVKGGDGDDSLACFERGEADAVFPGEDGGVADRPLDARVGDVHRAEGREEFEGLAGQDRFVLGVERYALHVNSRGLGGAAVTRQRDWSRFRSRGYGGVDGDGAAQHELALRRYHVDFGGASG